MLKNIKKREEGFTIIEVLIVLAIAGLIMLIVFLAVPALQRNQRNNARNNEASRMATAITECLANRNGSILTTGSGCGVPANISYGTTNQLTSLTYSASGTMSGSTTNAQYRFGWTCDTAGVDEQSGGPSSRSFALVYQLEGSGKRCIAS